MHTHSICWTIKRHSSWPVSLLFHCIEAEESSVWRLVFCDCQFTIADPVPKKWPTPHSYPFRTKWAMPYNESQRRTLGRRSTSSWLWHVTHWITQHTLMVRINRYSLNAWRWKQRTKIRKLLTQRKPSCSTRFKASLLHVSHKSIEESRGSDFLVFKLARWRWESIHKNQNK